MEEIKDGSGVPLAWIVREGYRPDGVHFISPPDHPLQLGVSHYPQGATIRPHIHPPRRIIVDRVEEVVHIKRGRVDVELYGEGGEVVGTVHLSRGDTILLAAGGHGFSFTEDTDIIEVKQGPYAGSEIDKKFL